MGTWLDAIDLEHWVNVERLLVLLRAAIIVVVGIILARLISSALGRVAEKRASRQGTMLIRRLTFYLLLALVLTSTLHQLGFKLGVILGAAGVLTVAIGFASQTSVSNLISGLFLIAERHFEVGDNIKVDDLVGEVISVDLLSVKVRTFDNLYVRLPNESIIKSKVTNLTKFPIRRLDLLIGVAYKEDMSKVRRALFDVADRNPLCLEEPKPLFIFKNFGESALELQFSVWAMRENYLALMNSVREEIKIAFDAHGIEIPFPHRTLYAGTVTEPFPVRVLNAEGVAS